MKRGELVGGGAVLWVELDSLPELVGGLSSVAPEDEHSAQDEMRRRLLVRGSPLENLLGISLRQVEITDKQTVSRVIEQGSRL
jgi:hypothetical protein